MTVVGSEVEGIGRRLVVPLLPDGQPPRTCPTRTRSRGSRRCGRRGASSWSWAPPRSAGSTARSGLHGSTSRRGYRLVDRAADGACAVYALHGAGGRTGADGLPLPPVDMIRMTSGAVPARLRPRGALRALRDGRSATRRLDPRHARTQRSRRSTSIGRAARLRLRLRARHRATGRTCRGGCTAATTTRTWCAGAPTTCRSRRSSPNAAEPPLPYEDGSFDFLYSISIFTHLDEPLQLPWMQELTQSRPPGRPAPDHGRRARSALRSLPGMGAVCASLSRPASWSCGSRSAPGPTPARCYHPPELRARHADRGSRDRRLTSRAAPQPCARTRCCCALR